jgi:hypothetical protein
MSIKINPVEMSSSDYVIMFDCFILVAKNDLFLYFQRISKHSQTCLQRPTLGPEKCGRFAEGCLKNIRGK